jgi:AcrR family transcriptional regulator
MSGKPQYDEVAVIAAAVGVFWRYGYAAASISDLTQATGLSRSSLYQRFQDKDGLFKEALARYTDRVLARMRSAKADSAERRLEALLRDFLPKDGAAPVPAGCLLSRSCAEQLTLSTTSKDATKACISQQKNVILDILKEGETAGELAHDANLDALAWYYLGTLQAIVNLAAAGASSEALTDLIDIAMSAWPKSANIK